MTPYYDQDGITIYCGDCRDILPQVPQLETAITDPVWPNSVFPGVADPVQLFADVTALLTVRRLVVHLGCSSDPRFLASVPGRLPFVRVCWLRYASPSYRGRILVGSDVAYVFGEIPASRPGLRVLSGEIVARKNMTKLWHTRRGHQSSRHIDYQALPHPCPRRYEHVAWLVAQYGDGGVIDPFMGSGTTLQAAKAAGLRAIGIEMNEAWCELAAERLTQGVLEFGPGDFRTDDGARVSPDALTLETECD